MKKITLLFAAAILMLTACVKDQVESEIKNYSDEEFAVLSQSLKLPLETVDYTIQLPNHLGGGQIFADKHKATLGRVLFYDKRLSANDAVSCASCHKAEKGFADDAAFSKGFSGELTSRNSLALGAFPSFNGYYGFGSGSRLFWDERANSVAEQSEQTLQNPIEMGMNLQQLGEKLLKEDYYKILFDKAFVDFEKNLPADQKILTAIDAFVNSIGCFQSKYDQALQNNGGLTESNFASFSPQENRGKQLFQTHCANCHNLGAGFTTFVTVANNGLDLNYTDKGVAEITKLAADEGVFKVPMLRNVALTAPFMHDGRFSTLEQVVEHYNSGVKNHPNLHELLRSGNEAKHLNLTQEDKAALVAFLHTLTDETSLSQVKYSDPFK